MATETLHYENARFAQQLYNHVPRNLAALETELGVKATSREGGMKVPEVLMNGNHAEIEKWRREQAKLRTKEQRPDLLK